MFFSAPLCVFGSEIRSGFGSKQAALDSRSIDFGPKCDFAHKP
jgi:hypothetical protein